MNIALKDNHENKRFKQTLLPLIVKPIERDLFNGMVPYNKQIKKTRNKIKKTLNNKNIQDNQVPIQREFEFKKNEVTSEEKGPKLTFLEERNQIINNKKSIIDQTTEIIKCGEKDAIKHSLDAAFNKLLHCNDENFLNNPKIELKKYWEENKWRFLQSEQASRESEHLAFEAHRKHFGPIVLAKTLEKTIFFDKQYLHKNLRIILNRLIDNEDENLLLDPVGYLADVWNLNKWQIIRTKKEYQERVLLIASEKIMWTKKNVKDSILTNGIQKFIREEDREFLIDPIGKLTEYFETHRPKSWHSKYD